jgi:hypothetical protein
MLLILLDGGNKSETQSVSQYGSNPGNAYSNITKSYISKTNAAIDRERMLAFEKFPSNVSGIYFGMWTDFSREKVANSSVM